MRRDIKDFIGECDTCQINKHDNLFPAGLLQPLPIPSRVWTDISIDFVEGLPLSQGYSVIFVVVDRLSKYAHFITLSHPYSAAEIAQIFIANVFKLHGMPNSIVSNRDTTFTSTFWSELFRLQGTTLKFSTSYHPQTDGQTEIVNKALENYLHCFAQDSPKNWSYWLPWAEYSYNTSWHSSTKLTPFEVVYGVPPPRLLSYIPGTTRVQAVDEVLCNREQILSTLNHNLKQAQQRMKKYADIRWTERKFELDQQVYLRLQPYRQTTVAHRQSLKLAPRFYGPFTIIRKVGAVAYELDLPKESRVHPVFHVSQLKLKLGSIVAPCRSYPQLIPMEFSGWNPWRCSTVVRVCATIARSSNSASVGRAKPPMMRLGRSFML
jgi:hypothetical protein